MVSWPWATRAETPSVKGEMRCKGEGEVSRCSGAVSYYAESEALNGACGMRCARDERADLCGLLERDFQPLSKGEAHDSEHRETLQSHLVHQVVSHLAPPYRASPLSSGVMPRRSTSLRRPTLSDHPRRAGGAPKDVQNTHRLEAISIRLGKSDGVVGGLARLRVKVGGIALHLRELGLDIIEGLIGVVVDAFQGQAVLVGLEGVEDGQSEGRGAVVEGLRVRVGLYVLVSSRQSVLDDRVALHLWLVGKSEASASALAC